jgi:HD-like signal output (HDOD) protein
MSTFEPVADFPRTTMSELVEDSRALISLPEIYLRLQQVMEEPDSSMNDVARVITLDPALTARLLRIANSALYNFPSKIETLSRAVSVLGLRQIHELVVAASVAQAFADLPNDLIDIKDFWYRSVYRGFIAKEIGAANQAKDTEGLFIRGLLLDIGHLVLYHRFPAECRRALADGAGDLAVLLRRERDLIGCDAVALGGALTRSWRLPAGMIASFDHLMQPGQAGEQAANVAIVHLAARFAHGVDTGLPPEEVLAHVHPRVWELLEVTPERTRELVEQASEDVLNAMYQVFAQAV